VIIIVLVPRNIVFCFLRSPTSGLSTHIFDVSNYEK